MVLHTPCNILFNFMEFVKINFKNITQNTELQKYKVVTCEMKIY
jgi:hypothetical protein